MSRLPCSDRAFRVAGRPVRRRSGQSGHPHRRRFCCPGNLTSSAHFHQRGAERVPGRDWMAVGQASPAVSCPYPYYHHMDMHRKLTESLAGALSRG